MYKFLITLIAILLFSGAYSQEENSKLKRDTTNISVKKFEKKALENYKSDPDFNYEEKTTEPNLIEQIFNWFLRQFMRLLQWLFGVEKATGIFQILLKILPYLVLGILLFLITKIFIKLTTKTAEETKNQHGKITISEDEELIKNHDLEALIQNAIANKNYSLAVRYLYIQSLKLLDQNKIITWEQQKTNDDYIAEIKSNSVQKIFTELTYLYDFVWYGNFAVSEKNFEKIALSFASINKLITTMK